MVIVKFFCMRYHNNPANIRYSEANKWYGLVGNDNGFCVFESVDYGVRALIILLRKYVRDYKKKSVQEIISRYAPVCENDTRNYVAYVESFLRKHDCDPDNIDFYERSFMYLCIAICWFETHTTITLAQYLSIYYKFHLNY